MIHRISSADRSALIRLAVSLPAGSESRRALLAGIKRTEGPLPLTEKELEKISDWGRAGQGVGMKATPKMIADLTAIGRKLPKKKMPTLYRGMCFPEGTLYGIGNYSTGEAVYPPGFVMMPSGLPIMMDPAFYKRIISGPRSWSTKITSAKYYAGFKAVNRVWDRTDCIIVRWLNPPDSAVLLDTRVIEGAGYGLATDTNEVLADASGAQSGTPVYDKFLMLTISG